MDPSSGRRRRAPNARAWGPAPVGCGCPPSADELWPERYGGYRSLRRQCCLASMRLTGVGTVVGHRRTRSGRTTDRLAARESGPGPRGPGAERVAVPRSAFAVIRCPVERPPTRAAPRVRHSLAGGGQNPAQWVTFATPRRPPQRPSVGTVALSREGQFIDAGLRNTVLRPSPWARSGLSTGCAPTEHLDRPVN